MNQTNLSPTPYVYHQDPGHGWLEVPRAEAERLGLLDVISHYSYQRNGTLYLEEDCDMARFLKAKDAAGEPWRLIEHYAEHTFIRNLPNFRGGAHARDGLFCMGQTVMEGGR